MGCGLHTPDRFGVHDQGTVNSDEASAVQAFCDLCHSPFYEIAIPSHVQFRLVSI